MITINNNDTHFEDVKKRLTALETLKDLLTPDEYRKKRADIVASIAVGNEETDKNECQDKKEEEEQFIPTATAEPVPLQNTSSTTVNIVMPQSSTPVPNTTSINTTCGSVYAGGTAGVTTKIKIGLLSNLCISVQVVPWDGFAIRAGQDLMLWPDKADAHNYQNWLYNPADQTIVLASRPELCMTVVGVALKLMPKILVPSPFQRWVFNAATNSINLASDPTTVISVATTTPYLPTFQQLQKVIVWKNLGPALSQKWNWSTPAASTAAFPTAAAAAATPALFVPAVAAVTAATAVPIAIGSFLANFK